MLSGSVTLMGVGESGLCSIAVRFCEGKETDGGMEFKIRSSENLHLFNSLMLSTTEFKIVEAKKLGGPLSTEWKVRVVRVKSK